MEAELVLPKFCDGTEMTTDVELEPEVDCPMPSLIDDREEVDATGVTDERGVVKIEELDEATLVVFGI